MIPCCSFRTRNRNLALAMKPKRDRSMESALKFLRRRDYRVRPFWTPQGWKYELRPPRPFFLTPPQARFASYQL